MDSPISGDKHNKTGVPYTHLVRPEILKCIENQFHNRKCFIHILNFLRRPLAKIEAGI